MAKFKIGDMVIGNKRANRYAFSDEGYVGEVIRFITDDDSDKDAARCRDCYGADMIIRGKHPIRDDGTVDFCVKSDCFDLIERDGVPYSSMSVGGITFTAAMPIISGPGLGPDDGMSIVPNRILKSGDRTIVFWEDGTKTIVKRAEDEADNDYAAFTAAFAIKLFGSNSALKRMIDKKLEYQKTKTEKKESPLHAEPVVDAMEKIGAMAIDGLVKKAAEFAASIGRREDDKK